jgi:YfiH family protein
MDNIYYFNNLSQESDCIHLVTTKNSKYPFNFSLALHTGENPKDILYNRAIIQERFPKFKFIVANQTHSDNIKIISNNSNYGWSKQSSAVENCDGLITDRKNLFLTILTADCVPILLFDPKQKVVSAIHAGWRGTAKKIVLKTIQKMVDKFSSRAEDIIAGVAPSIGRCCYEVNWEVAKYFIEYKDAVTRIEDKYMLDLPLINREQLLQMGVKANNIELSNICTSCNLHDYFSYRKEGGCSGRFMSMIANIDK